VVLSPHPDDDVIGCGGTLYKHVRAGDSVTVITLTDGARGMNHAAPPSRETAITRRAEAENAAALLGIRDIVFLDLPDGKLSVEEETVGRLIEELDRVNPRCMFLPFLLDAHRDHRAANRLYAAAVRRYRRPMEVYAYEVWTPLPANRLVDISEVAAIKEQAIRMHASQAGRTDYAAAALGLNRFRSLSVSGGKGYCEAFFSQEAGQYADLVERTLGLGFRE
jgi:LmbE family N-acetylglucosaminyl deacetylase